MKSIPLAAALALIALPAFAQSSVMSSNPDTNMSSAPAFDPGYNSNIGVTHDTAQEAQNDTSNGRLVDSNGQRNNDSQVIRSQQKNPMGEPNKN